MLRYRFRFIILAATISLLLPSSMFSAEMRRLTKSGELQPPSKYEQKVAELKQLISNGQCTAARKEFEQLKKDFPEIVGPDPNVFDAFIKGEVLLCKGKLTKAFRSYQKFLDKYRHESELYEAALDRQRSIATAFLSGQKRKVLGIFKIKGYATGEKLVEKIIEREGVDTPIGRMTAETQAECYEKRGKLKKAYLVWSKIFEQWKTSEFGTDVLLNMARCRHLAYRGPKYDASCLAGAKNYYENFKDRKYRDKERYPVETIDFDKIDKRLEEINQQLAYKQFTIGRYYQKTGNRPVANFYYRMVMDNWPGSIAAKMADERLSSNADSQKSRSKKAKK